MTFQAWKLEQERLKDEEKAKESKKEKKQHQQQQKEVVTEARDKKSRAGTAGSPAESITDTAPPVADKAELQPTEEPVKVKLTLLREHIDA